MSTIAPKWSDPSTPPPKVTLPEGTTAPRLGGSQKPLSRGFISNLRDFLMERPVKIPKGARGEVFTVEEYGGGVAENFKEWFKPTPKAVSSRMTVDWKPGYLVLWQNLRDLISPPKLPPLQVTSKPVKVKEIWSKDKAFGPSQMIALGVHIGITLLIFSPLLYTVVTKATGNPKAASLVAPLDISDYTAKLPARLRPRRAAVEAAANVILYPRRGGRAPKFEASTKSLHRWCTPTRIPTFRRLCSVLQN